MGRSFAQRLGKEILLLDGATGTELERRGVETGLPLWSARALVEAPAVVEQIHREYVEAGATIITANTFRTQRRTLSRGGMGKQAGALTEQAVALARKATSKAERAVFVAGSVAPLEDCYRPDRVPTDEACVAEHSEHIGHLAQSGVDLLLIETMNTIREATCATRAASATKLPVLVSFACNDRAELLSGEPLADAASAVLPLEPMAILVNCLPPKSVAASVEVLRDCALPFGVYANLGAPSDATGFTRTDDCTPAELLRFCERWKKLGATLLGGCCGTTPAHIRALGSLI